MEIKLEDINKSYGKTFEIKNLSLKILDGDFTTLLGPSGCGKTTILRMIAGLETPDSGEIYFNDKCIFSDKKKINIPPEKRNLGFVFQDFALWPHMSVFENVAFSLRAKNQTEYLNEKVDEAIKAVQLEEFKDRYPSQLSGGQQQRVAFARAIVGKPDCILFDEPLSALDAILRDDMRVEMKRITKELNATAVFVTHDQLEAMSMSDKIVVMNKGLIEQIADPEEIYSKPKTKFVAKFIGKSNWIDEHTMFRPEEIAFEFIENAKEYKTKVIAVQFLGNSYELCLDINSFHWTASSNRRLSPNEEITVYIHKENLYSFS